MNGIYIIHNLVNSKCYIGSSTEVDDRLVAHKYLLKVNKHHSYKLQGSFNKHGLDNFEFKSIEDIYFPEEYDKKIRAEYLECREGYYIKKFNSYKHGYNVSEIPKVPGNTNTKESIAKGIQTRRENGSYIASEVTRKRRSEGIKNSELFKVRQKLGALKRVKAVYQYDLDGNFIRGWNSIHDIVNELNFYKSTIMKNIRGEIYRCKNFIFSYEKKDKVPSYGELKTTLGKRSTHVIYMYDKNGELVDTFSDADECATKLQKTIDTVYGYLTRPSHTKNLEYKFVYGPRTK